MSVAVIVPCRLPAPWLGEALASVLEQDLPPDEVLVVDDGSEVPLVLPPSANRCRLVRLDRRSGAAAARDAGLHATTADTIALCDADDRWQPGKLRLQVDALARDTDAAVCFGRARLVDAQGRPTTERWYHPGAVELDPGRWPAFLFETNPVPLSSVVLRRAPLEAAGGFAPPGTPMVAEDWDLWLRLAARGERFIVEPEAVVDMRRHAAGSTQDIAPLAECQLELHERHAAMVDEETRARVRAVDLTGLARGRVRQRRYRDAARALDEAARLAPPRPRERLLRAALRIPVLRAGLGRRSPYRQ